MRTRSTAFAALSLLVSVGACEGLVDNTPKPPAASPDAGGPAPSGTGGTIDDPDPITGTGGAGTGGAVGTGGAGGTGGTVSNPDAGPIVGTGGVGGAGGAGGAPMMTPCGAYPAGPDIAMATLAVGTVVPNLSFKREDGTAVSFGDLRCDKKNKMMYWTVGGDNCPPCVATAKSTEIPAWKELGPQGLLMVASFNGKRFLVSSSPWTGWRTKTMWPPDDEHIAVIDEPRTTPYYVHGRISSGIPQSFIIELETMKVVSRSRGSVAALKTQLAAIPARP